ncbi:hypothetical protein NGM99_13980 [Mesorhizobium sp. RP14(2022)]|uniref:Uncharacterized protein n=1 Tax=Mesorhizobium liriopis TaxID=2953882 RepID=A0ABT1C7V2_9HYPH|nr:hypothetical protein [Mesorhizobium liriopis]MCO6050889.1 hypothetical protein [Mesorhizobium liriopis]
MNPLTDIAVPIAPTMRSQFEAWMKERGLFIRMRRGNSYDDLLMADNWDIWQAAWQAALLSSSKGEAEAPPDVHAALVWAMDEIDALSNKLCHFAYPQGMHWANRMDQQEAYARAVAARAALIPPAGEGTGVEPFGYACADGLADESFLVFREKEGAYSIPVYLIPPAEVAGVDATRAVWIEALKLVESYVGGEWESQGMAAHMIAEEIETRIAALSTPLAQGELKAGEAVGEEALGKEVRQWLDDRMLIGPEGYVPGTFAAIMERNEKEDVAEAFAAAKRASAMPLPHGVAVGVGYRTALADWFVMASGFKSERDAQALEAALIPSPSGQPNRLAELEAAARDVLTERKRQVESEGWTPEHDDEHGNGQMASAAGVYALNAARLTDRNPPPLHLWPWSLDWWKPTDRRRDLVKAGALILAEIERLDRAALSPTERSKEEEQDRG